MQGGLRPCLVQQQMALDLLLIVMGNIRGSELGQAEDSCAPSPIFTLTVLGASEASWGTLPV